MTKQEREEKGRAMYSLIEQWQQSEKTQKSFCREKGISYHVFGYWLKKYRSEKDHSGKFLTMQFPIPQNQRGIQIQFPNGIVIHLPSTIELSEIKKLIEI